MTRRRCTGWQRGEAIFSYSACATPSKRGAHVADDQRPRRRGHTPERGPHDPLPRVGELSELNAGFIGCERPKKGRLAGLHSNEEEIEREKGPACHWLTGVYS